MSDFILPELVSNILARLPIYDVLRCTSVCKSWYVLITSSSFISSHLKLSTPNQKPRLLLCRSIPSDTDFRINQFYSVHRDNQTFEQVLELDCPSFDNICGSLNGLFCLSDGRGERMMLWNPSLRKSLVLPKPIVASGYHSIGFGFSPTHSDYKIVRVSCCRIDESRSDKISPEVELYELRTGCWRRITNCDLYYDISCSYGCAYLNGYVHWTAENPNKVGGSFESLIVSFDMTSEKFRALMIPNCLKNDDAECLQVTTLGESLCLIDQLRIDFTTVWIMKEYGVAESWD